MSPVALRNQPTLAPFFCFIALVFISSPQIAQAGNFSMLKIAIKESASSSNIRSKLEAKEDLLNLIQQHSLRDAVIDMIPASDIAWRSGSTLSDTEGSGSSEGKIEKTYNMTKNKNRPIDNYASVREDISPQKLAQDAQQIHATLPERSAAATTILCVALKNSANGIKNLSFVIAPS